MSNSSTSTALQLSSPVYDKLKQVVQVLLPGFGALYLALAELWELPAATQVVGTCSALALFLGLALQVSSKSFNSDNNEVVGAIDIETTKDGLGKLYTLALNDDAESLDSKNEVRFRINHKQQ